MREIILQPLNLAVAATIFVAYFIILFHYTAQGRFALILEKLITGLCFFILPGVNIPLFTLLDPGVLFSLDRPLSSSLTQVFLYACIIIIKRPHLYHIVENLILLFKQPLLGLFFTILISSAFWSATPLITLQGSMVLLFVSTIAVHVGRQYNWHNLSKLIRWSTTLIAALSAFCALFVPSIGLHFKGWKGVMGHPIHLGNLMALSATLWLLYAFNNPKRRWISFGMGIFSLIVMQFANSAGAFCTFIVLINLLLLIPFLKRLKFQVAFAVLTAFMVVSVGLAVLIVENLDKIVVALNRDLTFTGRVPLWTALAELAVKQRPWLGYGYGGFWQSSLGADNPAGPVVRRVGEWAVHAHNGFLDICLSLGLIGLLLFVFSYLTNIILAILIMRHDKQPEAVLPLVILMFIILSNLSESKLLEPTHVWFYYIVIAVRLHIDTNRKSFSKL